MQARTNLLRWAIAGLAAGGFVLHASMALAGETVGPDGEKATPTSALVLTDAETAKLKEGKYTAALCWHT
ncbi:MAG: LacI family transcriptional regulator, partial [Hyphomicrobiales bacterium]|nr:LacI family transcriptional regulator [Hyphomicrobiales bacterium]